MAKNTKETIVEAAAPVVEEVKKTAEKAATATKKTAEKAAAATKKAATAAKKAVEPKDTVYVQFAGDEVDVATLVEAAKANFKAEKPRTRVTDLKLYVKPEERTAYYVINEKFDGKVTY